MPEEVSNLDRELSKSSSLFMIFLNAVFAAICIFIFGMMLGLGSCGSRRRPRLTDHQIWRPAVSYCLRRVDCLTVSS